MGRQKAMPLTARRYVFARGSMYLPGTYPYVGIQVDVQVPNAVVNVPINAVNSGGVADRYLTML